VRYRNTPWQTDATLGGGATARYRTTSFNGGQYGPDSVLIRRDSTNPTRLFTVGTYLQDNYTRGRLRLNMGIRWDYQNDEALAGCIEGNPLLPDLLPAQCFDGADRDVNFSDISPRLSATYDLFGTGKTVLKAGYAAYYGQGVGLSAALSQLGAVTLTFQNATGRTCWNDANGDQVAQRDELNLALAGCLVYPSAFDPATGLLNRTLNEVDPNLRNDRTREANVGVEHELMPNLAVGANYIYRYYDDFSYSPRIGELASHYVDRTWSDADFLAAGLDAPSQFGLPSTGWVYSEIDPTITRVPGTTRTTNNNEYRVYNGVDLTVTKRFSNKWMMNASLTVQDRKDHNITTIGDRSNDDKFEGKTTGTHYIMKLNGMYALPKGFNASANLQVQEGGNRGIFLDGPQTRSGGLNAAGTALLNLGALNFTAYENGSQRLPLVHLLDAQVTKSIDLRGGKNRLSLIFSAFNVLNANTIRGRNNDLNSANYDRVTSILSPRVGRVQASITF
jgi:hypothetical protein